MMHFERPPEPADFGASVHDARQRVEQAIQAGEEPEYESELWQRHKAAFATAQNSKCAYCEMSIVNHDAHVEHFAPKAELWELSDDADERGREIAPGLPNMRGRKRNVLGRGYYWRAYEWQNFLVACETCNTKWKGCFFPVATNPRRLPPDPEVFEPPLLLNPFDDKHPWRHFLFTEFGLIEAAPQSDHGRATIDTCGLDRPTLRQVREIVARHAYRHARVVKEQAGHIEDPRIRKFWLCSLESLYDLGGDAQPHAGMVRCIAEQVTKFSWDELCNLRNTFF